jgi:hypothetical protein
VIARAAILACCLLALAVPEASGAVRERTDRDSGVRFRLDGTSLKVTLPGGPAGARVRNRVWGKRVVGACASGLDPLKLWTQRVHSSLTWPAGAMSVTYSFPRDVSARALWCLVEDDTDDVAAVNFVPPIVAGGFSRRDRRIAQALRRYLLRNGAGPEWFMTVRTVLVRRGVITITTSLPRDAESRRRAAELCSLIQGADVADFTPGHRVRGRRGRTLRTCPARQTRED